MGLGSNRLSRNSASSSSRLIRLPFRSAMMALAPAVLPLSASTAAATPAPMASPKATKALPTVAAPSARVLSTSTTPSRITRSVPPSLADSTMPPAMSFSAGSRDAMIRLPMLVLASFSLSSASLNSPAWAAVSPLICTPSACISADSSSMPSRPWFKNGISSAPALPNSCTASAVFSAPSGMALKRSARSSSTASVPRNVPS